MRQIVALQDAATCHIPTRYSFGLPRIAMRFNAWYPLLLPLSIALNAAALFFIFATPSHASYGEGNPRIERLYATFISPCCWRENLTTHQSPDANRLRARISGMVKDGQTDDQIKQTLVAEYGKRVLSLPEGPARLWLFVTPAFLLAIGVGGLVWFLKRMRHVTTKAGHQHAPATLFAGWDEE
jgi:cytochrome c-type biogenesis protein CcmH/NrfF